MENVAWPALVIKAKSRTGAVDSNTQMTQMWCYFSPQENNSACLISEAGCTLTPVSEGCEKDATDAEMEGNAHDMSYESNLKDYSDPTHSEIKVNDDDMKPCRESANKAPISSATQTEKSRKHSFSGEKEQGCDNVEQKEEDNDDVALNMRDAFTLEIIDLPETETRETALLMTPEEHESNEEEKERDSAIKSELAAVSVKTFKDWLVDPNLYKVSLPDIKGKVIPIEVKTHNCSQAAVDGEQIYYKKMRSHVPISLFYISYTQRGWQHLHRNLESILELRCLPYRPL